MEKEILIKLKDHLKCRPNVGRILTPPKNHTVVTEVNKKEYLGFTAGCLALYSSSVAESPFILTEDMVIVHHWLSFCCSELFHCSSLQELGYCLNYINKELLNRPFLCGCHETLADIVIFISLKPFIKTWTYHQKEEYINISRWFKSMQMIMENTKSPIIFSRSVLYEEEFS